MKKQLLTLSLLMMSIGLFSQSTVWKPYKSNLDTAWGIRYLSVVDTNVVWGIGYNATTPFKNRATNRFTRTVNGSTFAAGTFLPDTFTYEASNISAVDANTAFVACYVRSGNGRSGIIRKTVNGGTTWTTCSDTVTMFTGAPNFPDVVHFYDPTHGWALGDPNPSTTWYEIWRTSNGGTNWVRVPAVNIPPATAGEYGLTNSYGTFGSNIWFGTNLGRVYRSNDTGKTWAVSSVPGMAGGVTHLAFRDAMNGMVWGYTAATAGKFLLKKTNDGGVTWKAIYQKATVGTYDISAVPKRNAFVSVGIDSAKTKYLTSVTYDDGGTWTVLESGTTNPFRMLKVQMLDSTHGWAGCFSNDSLPLGTNGMNKWMGPKIALGCPLAVSGIASICSGGTATLTAIGANTYTWSANAGSATTNTVSVSPTVSSTYTVVCKGSYGCFNAQTYSLTVTPTPTANVTSSANTIYTSNCGTPPTSATLTATGGATYSWLPGTGLSSTTAAVVTATPAATTTYTLTANNGSCSNAKTVAITVINCTGINQISVNGTEVSFYPNPSNGLLTVSLTNVKAGTVLAVSDMLGNEVYKTSVNSAVLNQNLDIDLSSLPKGVYLFGVSNGNQVRVQKLVIQ